MMFRTVGLVLAMSVSMIGQTSAMPDKVPQPVVLAGTIDDNAGHPLGGVKAVLLDCAADAMVKETISDGEGAFTLTADGVEPTYCLQFSKSGYQTFRAKIEGSAAAIKIHVKLGSA